MAGSAQFSPELVVAHDMHGMLGELFGLKDKEPRALPQLPITRRRTFSKRVGSALSLVVLLAGEESSWGVEDIDEFSRTLLGRLSVTTQSPQKCDHTVRISARHARVPRIGVLCIQQQRVGDRIGALNLRVEMTPTAPDSGGLTQDLIGLDDQELRVCRPGLEDYEAFYQLGPAARNKLLHAGKIVAASCDALGLTSPTAAR
jgi:hypothetical protein